MSVCTYLLNRVHVITFRVTSLYFIHLDSKLCGNKICVSPLIIITPLPMMIGKIDCNRVVNEKTKEGQGIHKTLFQNLSLFKGTLVSSA